MSIPCNTGFLSSKITLFFIKRYLPSPQKFIDQPFVCSYNTIMKTSVAALWVTFAGFFRPDHDPPCHSFALID